MKEKQKNNATISLIKFKHALDCIIIICSHETFTKKFHIFLYKTYMHYKKLLVWFYMQIADRK